VKKFFVGLLRFLLAVVLLFFTAALLWTLVSLPVKLNFENVLLPALIGFLGGLAFFILVSRLLVLYVFGHELTHWFAAKFFLRETGDMKVGSTGGSVAVQKPNIWITLAPYFIPFYTLVWLGVYGIFRFGYGPPNNVVLRILYSGIGLTYAFHVVLTVHSLLREQSDLKQHGRVLSLILILFCNTLLLLAGLLTVTHQWPEGMRGLSRRVGLEWDGVASGAMWLLNRAADGVDWVRGKF
jgi:hypothetical protein